MTLEEKIKNAKRRINELEELIEYWDNSAKREELFLFLRNHLQHE